MINKDHFSRQAAGYSRYRPAYPTSLIEFLVEKQGSRNVLWDVGTGNGQLARQLAPYFTQVIASDHSLEQLLHANGPDNIRFAHFPAETAPLPDSSVDLVTIAQAIHWFDRKVFYSQVRRIGKASSLIAAIGYGRMHVAGLEELLVAFHKQTFGEFLTKERTLVDHHYRDLDFPFEEIPCPPFEQSYQWDLDTLEGYFNTWSSVQKYQEKYGMNPVDQLMPAIGEALDDPSVIFVTFPYFMRLGIVDH